MRRVQPRPQCTDDPQQSPFLPSQPWATPQLPAKSHITSCRGAKHSQGAATNLHGNPQGAGQHAALTLTMETGPGISMTEPPKLESGSPSPSPSMSGALARRPLWGLA